MTETNKTAYVIEDEPAQLRIRSNTLQKAGYTVTKFATVDAALEHMGYEEAGKRVTKNIPDVILTDNRTPPGRHTGMELLTAAKGSGAALFLISADFNLTPAKIIAAGGKDAVLLKKPILAQAMLDEMNKALAGRTR